jgi:hypothetical protein
MTANKDEKRLVRRLAAIRGCSYTAALAELRSLAPDVSWKAYVDLAEKGTR